MDSNGMKIPKKQEPGNRILRDYCYIHPDLRKTVLELVFEL